jgi:2-isopropylmalate synthase
MTPPEDTSAQAPGPGPQHRDIVLYDTTLRDGMQREGMSVSVDEKIRIAKRLASLGIHIIEAGFPGSNPKDAELFRRMES